MKPKERQRNETKAPTSSNMSHKMSKRDSRAAGMLMFSACTQGRAAWLGQSGQRGSSEAHMHAAHTLAEVAKSVYKLAEPRSRLLSSKACASKAAQFHLLA